MFRQKARIRFAKQHELRFISHHDLMRCFERALRRAELPLRMSEGFHPHVRLSFPLALGVGIVGTDEVMEVELERWVPPAEIHERLSRRVPAGLTIQSVDAVAPQRKQPVHRVEYRVPVPPSESDHARRAIAGLMARDHVVVERHRRGKPTQSVDVRPFIEDLNLHEGWLHMHFRVTPGGTARPDELLELLGLVELLDRGAVVTRSRVVLQRENGEQRRI